jgi:hypothetical protein
MKKSIWSAVILLVLSYSLAIAQSGDLFPMNCKPCDGDTVYLDSVYDISANQKYIPFVINFANDEFLGSIRVPLTYYNPLNTDIYLDSISWAKSRVEYVRKKEIFTVSTSHYDDKKFLITVTPFPDEKSIPPGRGLLCTLYFHTGPKWDPNIEVEVDTTRVNHFSLLFINEKFTSCCVPNLPWKGLLGGKSTTDVKDIVNSDILKDYFLSCSYPNPFNASTTIEFSIPERDHVKLEIYNVLGQKVRTLIDKTLPSGSYRVEWNGKGERGNILSSGIYFYRIESQDFVKVNRMTLVK